MAPPSEHPHTPPQPPLGGQPGTSHFQHEPSHHPIFHHPDDEGEKEKVTTMQFPTILMVAFWVQTVLCLIILFIEAAGMIKSNPAPTTSAIVTALLDARLAQGGLTVGEALAKATEHPVPPTAEEIAEAVETPSVEEITSAVIEKLGEDGGLIEGLKKTIGENTKESSSATALEVWKLLASGIKLGDGSVLSVVQEGDKAVFVIDAPSSSHSGGSPTVPFVILGN